MPCTLPYGVDAKLELPLDRAQQAGWFVGKSTPVSDVRQATLDALAAPIGYPQLAQAVVAGDHVTIVVDRFVPRAGEIVAAVVERLEECGIGPEAVTVLFSDAAAAAAARLPNLQTVPAAAKGRTGPHVEVHDPTDRGKLGYLANTASGRGIYVNRAIGEADFVVVVGLWRGGVSWDYHGPYGAIYPTFSDADTQKRFRNAALLHADQATFAKSQEEVESVGWRAGAQFTVQVVAGAGDDAAAVVAGEISATARQCETLHAEAHRHTAAKRAKTVIAALSGRAAQSWNGVARALGAALEVVEDGGVVALCTELNEPLGPALELLSKCEDDRDAALAHLRKERPADLFAALQLAEAQRRVRVYLLSRLDTETVENLEMTPIGDPADVGRLAARGGSCLVVGDAQHAVLVGPDSQS
jgi:nickel-dependent lactate racemase